jgi:hypothetical protein
MSKSSRPPSLLCGGRWTTLQARVPLLEPLWLPHKCPVPDGDALVAAGLACQHLRCVHIHNMWDTGALAVLQPITFRHARTVLGTIRQTKGMSESIHPTVKAP